MIAIPRIEADASVGPNAPATGAVFYASIGRSRNEAARRPFEVYGYASSTTVHQSFGHSVCDPHRRLLWSGRMFGIGSIFLHQPCALPILASPRTNRRRERRSNTICRLPGPRAAACLWSCRPHRQQNWKQPVARSSGRTSSKTLNPCLSRSGAPTPPWHASRSHRRNSGARCKRSCRGRSLLRVFPGTMAGRPNSVVLNLSRLLRLSRRSTTIGTCGSRQSEKDRSCGDCCRNISCAI